MLIQIWLLCKPFFTKWTDKWLFTRMYPPMYIQILSLGKWFSTFYTSKWLFSIMYPPMHIQSLFHSECFFTFWTRKWLFTRMCSPVHIQGIFSSKPLFAFWTGKWFFTGMCSQMTLHVSSVVCWIGTMLAGEFSRRFAHMVLFPRYWKWSSITKILVMETKQENCFILECILLCTSKW